MALVLQDLHFVLACSQWRRTVQCAILGCKRKQNANEGCNSCASLDRSLSRRYTPDCLHGLLDSLSDFFPPSAIRSVCWVVGWLVGWFVRSLTSGRRPLATDYAGWRVGDQHCSGVSGAWLRLRHTMFFYNSVFLFVNFLSDSIWHFSAC